MIRVGRSLRGLLGGLLGLVLGCSSGPGLVERTGPSFAEAFPDPARLLRDPDVGAMRAKLSRTPLPATLPHHQRLLQSLRECTELRVENLLLFTEAVVVWEPGEVQSSVPPAVGRGPYVGAVDEILIEGAARLVDFQPDQMGRLLERAQQPEARRRLAEVLLARCELSDPDTLAALLLSFDDEQVQADFVIDGLLPRAELAGENRWLVLRSLRSPEAMRRVASELIVRDPDFGPGGFATLLRQAETDDARLEFLELALEWRRFDDREGRRQVLAAFSFDRERYEALERLLARSARRPWSAEDWAAVASTFSFDSSRLRLILDLWGGDRVSSFGEILPAVSWLQVPEERFGLLRRAARRTGACVEAEDLVEVARLFNQDEDRQLVFDSLLRHVSDWPTVPEAGRVLAEFDGGEARLRVLEAFAPHFHDTDVRDRDPSDPAEDPRAPAEEAAMFDLLRYFELESLRRRAQEVLGA